MAAEVRPCCHGREKSLRRLKVALPSRHFVSVFILFALTLTTDAELELNDPAARLLSDHTAPVWADFGDLEPQRGHVDLAASAAPTEDRLFVFGGEGAHSTQHRRALLDVDECQVASTNDCAGWPRATCRNTVGSFYCECEQGFEWRPPKLAGEDSLYGSTQGFDVFANDNVASGSLHIPIPFLVCGTNASMYVSTFTYVSFGGPAYDSWSLGASTPALPTLFIGTTGTSQSAGGAAQVIVGKEVVEDGQGYTVRFEGTIAWWAVPGNPEIVWELTVFASGVLRVVILRHGRAEGLFAMSDGAGGWVKTDSGLGANVTLWYTLPGCAVAPGAAGPEDAGARCLDIEECKSPVWPCNVNAGCSEVPGSFTCACLPGYVGDGLSNCSDVHECARGTDDCHGQAECSNTVGSFECACNVGYASTGNFTGVLCSDVDECGAGGVHSCHADATCMNTDGSFWCECNPGKNGTGLLCYEVDECTLGWDDCDRNATCSDAYGSFTCACDAGYEGNGTACRDIDECVLETHDCARGCENTVGSFACDCGVGYRGDGLTCFDVDECVDSIHNCHDNATCTNTEGSFTCRCDPGYLGGGLECSDINECDIGPYVCHHHATCTNTPGRFFCTCVAGWVGPDEQGFVCEDEDECSSGQHNCHAHAACANAEGSFTCSCNAGFAGSGLACAEVGDLRFSCTLRLSAAEFTSERGAVYAAEVARIVGVGAERVSLGEVREVDRPGRRRLLATGLLVPTTVAGVFVANHSATGRRIMAELPAALAARGLPVESVSLGIAPEPAQEGMLSAGAVGGIAGGCGGALVLCACAWCAARRRGERKAVTPLIDQQQRGSTRDDAEQGVSSPRNGGPAAIQTEEVHPGKEEEGGHASGGHIANEVQQVVPWIEGEGGEAARQPEEVLSPLRADQRTETG